MIHKTGKPGTDPQNYRPISLLTNLSKIAEKTILEKLKTIIEQKETIPEEQHGFRYKHGTGTQIIRITETILKAKNQGKSTGAVFMDISNAFDKVWHQGLIYKLIKMEIPIALTKLIASYLQNRKFYVRINEETFEIEKASAGVPQGSLLEPILYNLYTSDIPKRKDTTLGLYADDTAILAHGKTTLKITKRLQLHLNKLTRWYKKWRIKINKEKTQAIIFEYKMKREYPREKVKINNVNIKRQDKVKYLGIIMERYLKFNKHIEETGEKAKKIKGYLYPLIHRKSKLNRELKVRIYKSIIRPVMTYGSEVLILNTKEIITLERIQSKILREAIDAPWYIRNTEIRELTQTPEIYKFMAKLSSKAYKTMKTHQNNGIKEATNYDEEKNRRIKRPKHRLCEINNED
nr:PREDICTED: RNA-directed DNA polymerase from mobile element jockey-like [Tribolium castaneum]|eukprot:XP_015840350.1 PREDICTED: RNA-directed DNA polymerase from mobile element jockey-like [Tribolium castaneum]